MMSKTPNGHSIIQAFEQFSPKKYAMEGDKIGLQIGNLNKPVQKVMVTLDVLESVVDEAIEKQVDLIIAHHPPIFRALKTVTEDSAAGKIVTKCIKHDLAVYVAHTNLDIAVGGVNDLLASALQLTDTKVLAPTQEDKLKKLITFVPSTHVEQVREAISQAGAGHIGNYSHCTYSTIGEGTFLPLDGSQPFIGASGALERVQEHKLETIIPSSIEKRVVNALLKSHPYEEVAYDIIPLENKGEIIGLGRIGKLPSKMSLKEFAQHTKNTLEVDNVRVVGNLETVVEKVAVVGGDGNKYIYDAKFAGADVYVTGDLYFHTAHDAMSLGLNVVDPGHYAEKIMKQGVKRKMEQFASQLNWEVELIVSETNTDPFQFL